MVIQLLTALAVQNNFEGFFAEINLRKKKWLLSCSYNPTRKNIVNHVKHISTGPDQFIATYNNLILLGDFNVEPEEVNMLDFLNIYNLKNLVKHAELNLIMNCQNMTYAT